MTDTTATVLLKPLAYEVLRLFAEDGYEVAEISEATGMDWFGVRQIINIHADGHRTKARNVLNAHPPIPPEEIKAAVEASREAARERSMRGRAARPKATPTPKPQPAPQPPKVADTPPPPPEPEPVEDKPRPVLVEASPVGPVVEVQQPARESEPAPSRETITILAEAIDATPPGSSAFEPLAKATARWALDATDPDPGELPEPNMRDVDTAEKLLALAREHPDDGIRQAHGVAAEALAGLYRLVLTYRRRALVEAEIAACEARLSKLRQWREAA